MGTMRQRPLLRHAVLLAFTAAVSVPAAGEAATVRMENGYSGSSGRGEVIFDAAAGEPNVVSFAFAGRSETEISFTVVDDGAALETGPGCVGGGLPGEPAVCSMSPAIAPDCPSHGVCPNFGRTLFLTANLGDGDDSLNAVAIPAEEVASGLIRVEADGGEGADVLEAGPTFDRFEPGPGADEVRAGGGEDHVIAGSGQDAPDLLDLGPDGGAIDYGLASSAIAVSLDGVANDGAPGEGDNVIGATRIHGGPLSDHMIGTRNAEEFFGGYGDDTIRSRGGNDQISAGPGIDTVVAGPGKDQASFIERFRGGSGNDYAAGYGGANTRLSGGAGKDLLHGDGGDDRVSGGAGRDELSGGFGADRVIGGGGRDRLFAGQDDEHDYLRCGAGDDGARAGDNDSHRGCEVIFRGGE